MPPWAAILSRSNPPLVVTFWGASNALRVIRRESVAGLLNGMIFAVIMAIVDTWEVDGDVKYIKDEGAQAVSSDWLEDAHPLEERA